MRNKHAARLKVAIIATQPYTSKQHVVYDRIHLLKNLEMKTTSTEFSIGYFILIYSTKNRLASDRSI